MHIPAVGAAYTQSPLFLVPDRRHTLLKFFSPIPDPVDERGKAVDCLLDLTEGLLTILERIYNGEIAGFKLGGTRGTSIPHVLLVRRTFDIVYICMLNIMTITPVRKGTSLVWQRLQKVGIISRLGLYSCLLTPENLGSA